MARFFPAGAVLLAIFLGHCRAGLAAEGVPKPAEPAERKRIEITEPGVYKDSDCLYVMTKDVTAKGCGFTFEGSNYVVDLGGHTLTFNAEPYTAPPKTKYDYQPPWGILLRGQNGELRNGAIVQGKGHNKRARCVFVKGKNYDIHDVTTFITGGWLGFGIFAKWGGVNVKLHHNYIVSAEDCLARGIGLQEAGPDWDIHHNTVVGGHTGIAVSQSITARRRGDKYTADIHHNYISHSRTRQQKTPQGIVTSGIGIEVHHNEICSIDGRGLKPTTGFAHWHKNVVDVRYTRKAAGGFYPENRCYGLWARDQVDDGSVIADNLFVVNNEIMGDDTSNSIGVLLCTSPGDLPKLRKATVTGNRFIVRHNDKTRPAWGFALQNTGDEVLLKDNYIWSDTAGVYVDNRTKGSRIEGNTFVRPDKKWQLKTGPGIDRCVFKDNKVVPPPDDKVPPAAPTGLAVTRRFNGFELHWNANQESDVLGYYVYRKGVRVEDRLKCGRFYVDTSADPKGACSYAVSAVDLSGNEGPKGLPVSSTASEKR